MTILPPQGALTSLNVARGRRFQLPLKFLKESVIEPEHFNELGTYCMDVKHKITELVINVRSLRLSLMAQTTDTFNSGFCSLKGLATCIAPSPRWDGIPFVWLLPPSILNTAPIYTPGCTRHFESKVSSQDHNTMTIPGLKQLIP